MDKYIRANIVFSKFSRDNRELKRYLPIRPSEMGALNIIIRHEGDIMPLAIAERLGTSARQRLIWASGWRIFI